MDRRIIVIGGGAAGLMAAGRAAQDGASVLLLEKMARPGRKLSITGNGRGNLTNTAPLPDFLRHFRAGSGFLRAAFGQFFSADLLALLDSIGVRAVVEEDGRVFPARGDAGDVADRLAGWARASGVTIQAGTRVTALRVEAGAIRGVEAVREGEDAARFYPAAAVILATGGASYPGTGSSGDGFRLAAAAGHTIVPPRPALVPLVTAGEVAPQLQGLSLRDARPALWIAGRKAAESGGDVLFTHYGLSGPAILRLSRDAVAALDARQPVEVRIDLFPALDDSALDARLLALLADHPRQQVHNLLGELLPERLIPVLLGLADIPPETAGGQLPAANRRRLRGLLKGLPFGVTGQRGFKEAIVTAGGVDTREIDPRTLGSRRVAGLYLAGEVLDIDADTGGFNLQAAFSTGWVAGRAAARAVREESG